MQMPHQAVEGLNGQGLGVLLTRAEVASIARVSEATVKYWRATGAGPRGFRLGRRVVYRADDVQKWIEQQYSASSAPGGAL